MTIFGRIYKITNKINNKVYIGQTTGTINNRFSQHKRKMCCPKLARAFKKYGIDNFIIEEMDTASSSAELNLKEIHWISKFNSVKNGYNIDFGGTIRNPSVGKKISKALFGKPFSMERRSKLSAQRTGRKIGNYNTSEESKSKKRKNHRFTKPIIDNFGNIYESIHHAAEKTKIDFRTVSAIINGKCRQARGFTFSTNLNVIPEIKNKKSIIPIVDQYGTVYNSINEASAKLHIDPSSICKVLTGKAKQTCGYVFSKDLTVTPTLIIIRKIYIYNNIKFNSAADLSRYMNKHWSTVYRMIKSNSGKIQVVYE